MQFEYEIRLKDGRLVNVVGEAEVTHACDCGDALHEHIDAVDVQSAVLIVNDGCDAWLELEPTGNVMQELEGKIEDRLYAEMAEAA